MAESRDDLVSDGALSVAEAVRFTGVSRSELYLRMERGELAYTKVGRRRLIPRRSLCRMLERNLVVQLDGRAAESGLY